MKRTILVGVTLVLSSCGFQLDSKKVNNQSESGIRSGIIGGEAVNEKDPLASGVVAVINVQDGAICTGSLIGPNIVLTAAHCAYQTKPHLLKIVFGIEPEIVMSTREPDVLREYVRTVDRTVVHSGYNPEMHETQNSDWNDIAILRFRGSHPEEYTPVELLPSTSLLKEGQEVRMVGYGVSEVKVTDIDAKTFPNLEEAMAYGEVLCDDDEKLTGCVHVETSGDGELRQTQAPIKEILKTEVVLDESHGHGSCMGDSGGPLYLEQEGHTYLFGVTSRGGFACNDVGIYTNAAEFKTWIADSIEFMNSKK